MNIPGLYRLPRGFLRFAANVEAPGRRRGAAGAAGAAGAEGRGLPGGRRPGPGAPPAGQQAGRAEATSEVGGMEDMGRRRWIVGERSEVERASDNEGP